jgi:uncharacterized delta-60 repeat protein
MKNIFTRSLLSFARLLFVLGTGASLASPGRPDPDFNGGSAVNVPVSGSVASADAVFALPGNKMIVAGLCQVDAAIVGCAVRLNVDGSVDNLYGTGGFAKLPSTQIFFSITSFALQPDGKLVVAGACSIPDAGWQFCARRFRADGVADEDFGASGLALARAAGSDNGAWAVASQADGKIVMSGHCRESGLPMLFCTVRLSANGSVDTDFGANGFASLPGGAGFQAKAIAIQADGKIIVTGYCKQSGATGNDFCIQRYRQDGVIDSSFGLSGEALAGRADLDPRTKRLAIQPDFKYLVASDVYLARFTPDGALDTTFGTGGVVGGASGELGLQLQPDGRIIAGCTGLCATRYLSEGELDLRFGLNGYARLNPAIGIGGSVRALRADGRILVAARCVNSINTTQRDFCVARFLGGPYGYENCKPDLDGDGVVTATIDALIFARIALGMTGDTVLSNISFPEGATRNDWPKIRSYLSSNCGLKIP